MEKKYSCCITLEESGYTVKQVLVHKWKLGTGQIRKAKFRENGILVNGKRVTVRYRLQAGDRLEVLLEEKNQASSHLIPVSGTLRVIYEDEDILVVEKPAGIVCHPSAGHYCDSMANLLVGYFAEKGEGYVVRLAGRLDKGTSGLLLYAKHAPALTELERQRADGRMRKMYYAILTGCPSVLEGDICEPVGADPVVPMKQRVCSQAEGGVSARTHYEIVWQAADKSCSLARITIATGRTHQIRVHMSWLGFPLVGDTLYGGMKQQGLDRQALHAYRLSFGHPVSGEKMCFSCDLPQDMAMLLEEKN
ncbi:MAG: RluA family pseudouridine synthase [Lachnospiraceae bacterium]